MEQSEINAEISEFINYLKDIGVKKNGPMISATFGLENVGDKQIVDMEFMVPLDRKIDLPAEYTFKSEFHLVNALYTRYIGNPVKIEDAYRALMNFIEQNQLHQITVGYNVNVNDGISMGKEPVIDIYIGINPSKL